PLALLLEQLPVSIWTTDADLRITSLRGRDIPELRSTPEIVGMTMAERLGTSDPAFPPMKAHLDALEGRESRYTFDWQGVTFDTMVIPLRGEHGRVEGCMGVAVNVTERVESQREREETLRRLERLNVEREALLRHLVKAEEEERKRIASGIHDDSIQVITAAGMALDLLKNRLRDPEAVELAERARANVSHAIDRLRTMVFALRPSALDEAGLAPAIRLLLKKAALQLGFEFSLVDETRAALEPDKRYVVYQIVQESIANIRKHAAARNVDVRLSDEHGSLCVTVRDDGRGFDATGARDQLHFGLTDMRERAQAVGGTCTVTSAEGGGTVVEILIPADPESVADRGPHPLRRRGEHA
ncbi:MAG TPA: ATP-binding protein, partial [Actinomycetota bacterium]|nr:ATP-binding protein [Actinomycetota bacterium]